MTKLVSGKLHTRQVYLISDMMGRDLLNYSQLAYTAKIDFPGLTDSQITCGTAKMEDNSNHICNGFPCITFRAPEHEVPEEYQNFQSFSVV